MGQQVSTTAAGCEPGRPSFPSLYWPAQSCDHAIYYLWDSWRFTTLWTLILYAIFHMGAAGIALGVQVGKHRSTWKYLWTVPIIYAFAAALEAVISGSIVGVLVGAVYFNGRFLMSTWIPFIWGWINVLVLIVSSFTIQGGL
ncbi:hypothetical protein BKA67DRAFT_275800 [Truncatella angustata]|uniref:Integral membrane protein n=1 Tax=Truncatella angustata TaxID=152316 RepID=A0A9P8ULF4_9PEZI|nr:uncharacterized protein BKA67DRAFT_275800 [Truncatella angustata]KAH6654343.1 hypothetical protein BKA67DRAFT_275800 [Truncatella angustata]